MTYGACAALNFNANFIVDQSAGNIADAYFATYILLANTKVASLNCYKRSTLYGSAKGFDLENEINIRRFKRIYQIILLTISIRGLGHSPANP